MLIHRKEIELQDTSEPVVHSGHEQAYEMLDTPQPVEYEEINKFQKAEDNPTTVVQPHPPKEAYDYTLCPAYVVGGNINFTGKQRDQC